MELGFSIFLLSLLVIGTVTVFGFVIWRYLAERDRERAVWNNGLCVCGGAWRWLTALDGPFGSRGAMCLGCGREFQFKRYPGKEVRK